MKRIKRKLHYLPLILLFVVLVFCVSNMASAQANSPTGGAHAPEPATLALMSITGMFGWIVRFARKRFQEFKRAFDIVVSITGLIISAPIVAVTAIFIKIVSPGPVFFKQERLGLNSEPFTIYKMRTMRLDAEKESGAVWAKENDPRFIALGKYIRKAHIDEIPQLFNVLKGDMSIVGPRPERAVFVEKLSHEIPEYEKRLNVKPGITGLAQCWHKYDETIQDVKKKVKFDLLYIRKMCLWVDVRILLRTVVVVLTGHGAR